MMRRPLAVLAAALAAAACGSAAAPAYVADARAADLAYRAGRYEEAANRFELAAKHADRVRDRDEALYRRAASFARAGRNEAAREALKDLVRLSPRGDRAPRAAFDHAELTRRAGAAEASDAELDAVLFAYPDSGVAASALARRVADLSASGEPAVRAYLDRLIPKLGATELGERLYYDRARSLEREGKLQEARAAYLSLADRFPYPRGTFWDDALFRAADLEDKVGDPRAAVALLSRMLRERERAYIQGSYEKGRYAEAQFRIGELYRDRLGDPASARAAFERFWSRHETSRLRDDAAWNAATLAARAGDTAGACRTLEALVRELPDSRYAPCASRLCPDLASRTRPESCHAYLTREPVP